MPIPATDCPPGVAPDVCCNTFSLIGDRIRTVAFEGVLDCMDPTCGDREFRSYLTFGVRIEDVLGESLIVTMLPATNAPLTTTRQGRMMPMSVTRLTYRVELRENGWPQPKVNEGGLIEPADSGKVNAATFHTMAHAEKMWRTLVNAAARRGAATRLFPLPQNNHILQGAVNVSDLTPIGPQGPQAAWAVTVTVDAMLG